MKAKTRSEIIKDKSDNHKNAMMEALKATHGNVSAAAAKVDISRKQHYEWLKTDPEYAQTVHDIQEGIVDFSESALLKQIKEGNIAAIIFHLKTQGKRRGYVERIESTGADGGPLKIEAADMDESHLDKIINAIKGGQ